LLSKNLVVQRFLQLSEMRPRLIALHFSSGIARRAAATQLRVSILLAGP
jgi:hypothetical protein